MTSLRRLRGWFRRFRSFVLRSEVEIVGQCALCGGCCRDILIRDGRRWLTSRRRFEKLCRKEPEYARFTVTGEDDKGRLSFTCTLQGEDNFCTCYDSRLPLCRNYPSKSLYYQGGWLRTDCGFSFKAKTFRDAWTHRRRAAMPKFSTVLRQETERKRN